MSLFDWFADRRKNLPVARSAQVQEMDEGDGLWSKCPR
ncbi:MAG: acetyl-CoA carboxylase carboxyl transferase subunit beta, partial [Cyanobacteriota bacterium]